MKGSRSAGQLGDQRGAMLVTSPSTRPIYWLLLMCARALTVPGHLRSSTGWVEGGRGGHRRPPHLFSSQAICSVSLVLHVGRWRTLSAATRPPTRPSTAEHGQSRVKMVSEAQETHAAFSHLFMSVSELRGAASHEVLQFCRVLFSRLLGIRY